MHYFEYTHLLVDFESKELPKELINLAYLKKKKDANKCVMKMANWLVNLSDGNASYLLILQLIVSIVLFLMN